MACLFIHCVVPFIHLYTFATLFPHSIAVTKTLLEISFEGTFIRPNVLTITLRQSIHILTFIDIAIYEPLCTLSMFQTILEYSDIEISIQLLMQSLTIRQATPPFAFIVLYKIIRLLIFGWHVKPVELSLPMLLAIQKLPYIQIAIRIDLHAFPIFLVAAKITLV